MYKIYIYSFRKYRYKSIIRRENKLCNKKYIYLWEYLALPKEMGDLGFAKIDLFNDSLIAKQLWKIFTQTHSLLNQVLLAKYVSMGGLISFLLLIIVNFIVLFFFFSIRNNINDTIKKIIFLKLMIIMKTKKNI